MTTLDRLGADALGAIAGLCARAMPEEALTEAELAAALFDDEQPAVVRGDPSSGIVVTVRATGDGGGGFVRLLVVDPSVQRQGLGRALMAEAERDFASEPWVAVGGDAPFYLFTGVETVKVPMLCFLEKLRYDRREANFNMAVDLDALAPDPGGHEMAAALDGDALGAWFDQHWPNWRAEGMRALRRGTLVVSRDAKGVSGICCFDVNRAGMVGPVAVRPDLLGRGAGEAVLLGALHHMRDAGRHHAEICWVGPVRPYARVGARITRVFFVYRKRRK